MEHPQATNRKLFASGDNTLEAQPEDLEAVTAALASPGPTCRLFALPAELRNKIYGYVVYKPDGVQVYFSKGHVTGDLKPALSSTCRQIRDEATAVYYEVNVVRFFISTIRNPPCPWHEDYYQKLVSKHDVEEMKHITLHGLSANSTYEIDLSNSISNPFLTKCGNGHRISTSPELVEGRKFLEGIVSRAHDKGEIPVLDLSGLKKIFWIFGGPGL